MNALYLALVIFEIILYRDVDAQRSKEAAHRPAPPPFLRTVNAKGKREYYEILKKKDETIAAQKEEILRWAETYGVEDQVRSFEANITKHKEEVQSKVTELLDRLPVLYKEILAVYNNEDQTAAEKKEELDKIRLANQKEYNVILFATSQFRPKRSGPVRQAQRGRRDTIEKRSQDFIDRLD
ncbi:unnamed protein product [Cylicocyclus nassatus]|uniref:SXP/RAL-2 family protein Ani s 5-like cation-binding domain-containing protein n=1 Tax=Cylicocyclus nassatus TaxID=53992 RepID=A0AA36H1I2_CYLNA|nr:unnamed protein product [Cylicocyclus nassatus]